MGLNQRYRAIVEYDGTDFLGYQIQAQGRTVQGELEKSLRTVTQCEIRVAAAGRTDAGVHAVGQVIAFDAVWKHPLEELHRALNATLPPDIGISELKVAPKRFHPRFDAVSRCYHYRIINQHWPSILQRRYAYHVKEDLDVTAMREASRLLPGRQDFAAFGKPPQGDSTVRHVMQADWSVSGPRLVFKITANAFLYRMVRRLVGTLVQVGLDRLAPTDIEEILESRDLTQSAPPAPAHGLCLVAVIYPNDN